MCTRNFVRGSSSIRGSTGGAVCLRAGGGPRASNASWHEWVSRNAEGSVSRRRPSPCDYIRSSSRPSHTHRLLRSRRLSDSRTASWVSQVTSTDSRDSLVGVRGGGCSRARSSAPYPGRSHRDPTTHVRGRGPEYRTRRHRGFRGALDLVGVQNELVTYESAPHSFFDRNLRCTRARVPRRLGPGARLHRGPPLRADGPRVWPPLGLHSHRLRTGITSNLGVSGAIRAVRMRRWV